MGSAGWIIAGLLGLGLVASSSSRRPSVGPLLPEARLASKAQRTRAIFARYEPLFRAYHGGQPLGFMAAAAQWESDGRMDAPGDSSLGERGVFQVSAHTEVEYRVPTGTRTTLEGNFYLAGVDYACEAARLAVRYPRLVRSGSDDQWCLSRLVFSIGRGGTYALLGRAQLEPGPYVYARLVAWTLAALDAGELEQLGSQSPEKVAFRVQTKLDQWAIGALAGLSMASGVPYVPKTPAGISPATIPTDLRGHIARAS